MNRNSTLKPSTKRMKQSGFKRNHAARLRTRRQMSRIGAKGRANKKANATLAKTFIESGLPQYCEARFEHECSGASMLTWAHNAKRRKQPDLLHAALLCQTAHQIIEVKPPEEMKRIVDGIILARATQEKEAA